MTLSKYQITFKAIKNAVLPGYLGSMLRGAFGEALMQYDEKLFDAFFNNKVEENNPAYKYVLNNPPAPFVIFPHRPMEFVRKNERIIFTFTLFGEYIQYDKYLIKVFDIMSTNGMNKEQLQTIFEEIKRIPCPLTQNDQHNFNEYQKLKPEKHSINLQFISPFSINYNKKIISDFSFERIFSFLYRRMFILDNIYGNKEITKEMPFPEPEGIQATEIRLRLEKIYRSPKRSEKYPMKGWKGKIRYAGDFSQVYPYLKFGEHLHAGSNTVFGFGKYILQ